VVGKGAFTFLRIQGAGPDVLQMARDMLHWDRPFQTVRAGGFETGDIVWFPEGGLNASYNCVDRWAFKHPEKVTLASFLHL
jgi:hypothetical protein